MTNISKTGRPPYALLALAAAALTAACSAPPQEIELDSTSRALAVDWNGWLPAAGTEGFTGGIGSCATPQSGALVLARKVSTGIFHLTFNKWRASTNPIWTALGTRAFASKPACTSLDEDPAGAQSPNHRFVVLGRGTDNRLYARASNPVDTTLTLVPGTSNASPPDVPTFNGDWHTISANNDYTSAAAATVAFGKLLVVARRGTGSSSRLYLHRNTLGTTTPYNAAGWSSSILQVPALPSPWTLAGDPAIANTDPYIDAVVIVARATAPGQPDTLFQIYWQGEGSQSYFWDSAGSENTWQFLPTGHYVHSDPAIVASSWVSGGWVTVFVRGSDSASASDPTLVYQGTGISWMWAPFDPIAGSGAVRSGPAALVGDTERCYHVYSRSAQNDTVQWSHPSATTGISCP